MTDREWIERCIRESCVFVSKLPAWHKELLGLSDEDWKIIEAIAAKAVK